jgi:tetratricopeptide (TPR) repeat protein
MQQDPASDLRARWESERSPQLTLQLAEEYRRADQVVKAIEVLREGLEHHPSHIAARVALGRYLFDAGNADEAVTRLEEVVNEDPTHLVANKILVEAYLGRGEVAKANDRLEFYALLTEGDPEVGSLRARVSAVAQGFSLPPTEEAEEVVSEEEPFGDLWGDLSVDGYNEALAAEGIFSIPAAAEPETVEPVEVAPPPAPVVEQEAIEAVEELSPPIEVAAEEAIEAVEEVPPPVEVAAEETIEAVEELSPPIEVAAEEAIEVIEEAPPLAEVVEEEATVTLGRLYLDQGHREEAARIFRSVLVREPENREARLGLIAAEAEPGGELTAAALVRSELFSQLTVDERKRVLLENYLKRLKGEGLGVS